MSLIQVSNLTFGYEGSFDNVFENASFSMDTNWRCGFIGRNGRGKTTFLNLLLGKYAYSGTISASVNFEYFPFEVENPDDTPLEIAESIMPDFEMWRLTRELNLLDADPGLLYRPYSTLSYGERTKVLLSILFIRENSFLLIDEPTNHLDIEARGTLAQYLKSKKGFILVSHDRAFLERTITGILELDEHAHTGSYFAGAWTSYLAERAVDARSQQLVQLVVPGADDRRRRGRAGAAPALEPPADVHGDVGDLVVEERHPQKPLQAVGDEHRDLEDHRMRGLE